MRNAELVDVMPTILQTYGIAIPSDVSGKVLMDIFREDSIFRRDLRREDYNVKIHIKKIARKLSKL